MTIGEHQTDEHLFDVIFPRGWGVNLCRRWLRLRGMEPPEACINADVYRWDSLYATCHYSIHGYWLQGWPLSWTFKKLV